MAHKCLHLIRQQQIAHEFSAVSSVLSVSLGVGTTHASQHATALEFVEQVDQLLYKAKHNGRMRAEFADFRD
ncbi:GGDEF domain protein [compost metagenome]